MNVLISAGEASGDAYGAVFLRELLKLQPTLKPSAIGSHRLRDAGAELLADASTWGAISIHESAKVAPRILVRYLAIKRWLRTQKPGLFVPIDFGFANIRLARAAKAAGWKILYLVPPGSWRRDRQGGDLPTLCDAVVTPFPWSAEIINRMGGKAHFFGHPIKQLHAEASMHRPPTSDRDGLAVLPGSRRHEQRELLPVFAAALCDLPERLRFPVPMSADEFSSRWATLSGRSDDMILDSRSPGKVFEVLASSQAGLVCSGTATLEAALAKTPLAGIYIVSKLTQFETKVVGFKRPKFVTLPNIILDRQVIPELIQEEATKESVRQTVEILLYDEKVRQRQLADFEVLDELLGPPTALTRAAELAAAML